MRTNITNEKGCDFLGRIGYMNNVDFERLSDLYLLASKTRGILINFTGKSKDNSSESNVNIQR